MVKTHASILLLGNEFLSSIFPSLSVIIFVATGLHNRSMKAAQGITDKTILTYLTMSVSEKRLKLEENTKRSGARGTCSSPVTPHRIQNPKWC